MEKLVLKTILMLFALVTLISCSVNTTEPESDFDLVGVKKVKSLEFTYLPNGVTFLADNDSTNTNQYHYLSDSIMVDYYKDKNNFKFSIYDKTMTMTWTVSNGKKYKLVNVIK